MWLPAGAAGRLVGINSTGGPVVAKRTFVLAAPASGNKAQKRPPETGFPYPPVSMFIVQHLFFPKG